MTPSTGIAGRVAAAFIHSKLTPLVIIASLLLGLYAVFALPREEEPQIIVPMIDVFAQMPGASPTEIEQRVTRPLEKLLWEVPGDARVRSGQFGRARFRGPARQTLTVPAAALLRRGQMTFVFTAGADGVARLRPVSIAEATGDRVELLAGVHDGERVVTNPPVTLVDGNRVAGERR